MNRNDVLARARAVRMLILDVDGVLTDGSLYFTGLGEEMKQFDVRDGHGMRMLADEGVSIAIVSGRRSEAVARRAEGLGVMEVLQDVQDKLGACRALAARHSVSLDQCGAMGDDLPDLPMLRNVGFAATVPSAHSAVRASAHYVSGHEGGRGAVRELCELILNAQGKLQRVLEGYLR